MILANVTASTAEIALSASKTQAQSAIFYYNRGIDKYNDDDYYGAIAEFGKAIEVEPRFGYSFLLRGYSRLRLKDTKSAIDDFNMALKIFPNYKFKSYKKETAYYYLGLAYGQFNDAKKAIVYFAKAEDGYNKDAEYFYVRGAANYDLGLIDNACSDWRLSSKFGDSETANSKVEIYIKKYCQ